MDRGKSARELFTCPPRRAALPSLRLLLPSIFDLMFGCQTADNRYGVVCHGGGR